MRRALAEHRLNASALGDIGRAARDQIEDRLPLGGGRGHVAGEDRAGERVDKFHPGGLLVVRAGGAGGLMSGIIGGWTAQRRRDEVQIVSGEIGQ